MRKEKSVFHPGTLLKIFCLYFSNCPHEITHTHILYNVFFSQLLEFSQASTYSLYTYLAFENYCIIYKQSYLIVP